MSLMKEGVEGLLLFREKLDKGFAQGGGRPLFILNNKEGSLKFNPF